MSDDQSGIRIKRVGPDEETAALPTAPRTGDAATRHEGLRPGIREERGSGLAGLRRDGGHRSEPFWLTSEFLLAVGTILAVLIAGYANDDSLNAWRTWLLVTVIASAYVVSRGIAKAGGHGRY